MKMDSTKNVLISLGIIRFVNLKRKERQKQRAKQTKAYLKMTKALKTDFYRLKNIRMDETSFFRLLGLVRPILQSQHNDLEATDLVDRLLITLKYLGTGCSLTELTQGNNLPESQILQVIGMTSRAIFKALHKYSKMPSEEKEWLEIAESFEKKWNFSHCAGAYSARHIAIDKPSCDEDKYRNYKDFHSEIAVAVVNASYEFIYYEFGFYGGSETHNVYTGTSFFETMIEDSMNLPKHSPLDGTDVSMPYIFVSDVYYLIENIMRTYSSENLSHEEKVFNYRLCRAKRVADNAFGVLYERFGVLHQNICIGEDDVHQVVLACFALHNFLVKTNEEYLGSESLDAEDETNLSFKTASWRLERREGMSWDDTHPLLPVLGMPEKFHDYTGQSVRENFTKYFSNEARLPFQELMVNVVPELKSVN